MTYMDKSLTSRAATQLGAGIAQESREPRLLVVEDGVSLSEAFRVICECLNVAVEHVPSSEDLGLALRNRRPMAVLAEMDAAGQDGCHVLMTIAAYDRSLPVMLIAGPDPALFGAIDAVEEIWHLGSVEKLRALPGVGAMVDFLFRAGRKGHCMRLMSV